MFHVASDSLMASSGKKMEGISKVNATKSAFSCDKFVSVSEDNYIARLDAATS
jgi:hypothetical protein